MPAAWVSRLKSSKSDTPIHPGELLGDYMQDRGWNQRELARRWGVTPKHVCEVLAGRAPISVRLALRLEYLFPRPARFWINLQSRYDLAAARRTAAS